MKGKMLATQQADDWLVMRTYEDGWREPLVTAEVPLSVLKGLGMNKVTDALAEFERGRARTQLAKDRKEKTAQMIKAGHSTRDIAKAVGVSITYVQLARKSKTI